MRVAVRPPAELLARLESGPRGLLEVAEAVVPEGAELLLVVDQLEEAFTLTESEDDRALLLESLRVATADPASRVRISPPFAPTSTTDPYATRGSASSWTHRPRS